MPGQLLHRVVANFSRNPLGFETTTENSNFTMSGPVDLRAENIQRLRAEIRGLFDATASNLLSLCITYW